MHGSILPVTNPPPRATPGTSPALRARGWGIVWNGFVPGVGGAGQIENNFSSFLWSTSLAYHFSVDTMAPDRVEKTAYFQGKSLEFVADWLEKNNLSKL